MSLLSLPVRRPVATSMFFTAVVLLGVVALWMIPVELMPPVSGDELYVSFFRPGSEAEIVERELLIPLEGRVSELEGVEESGATVLGSSGTMWVRFAPGSQLKVRELELRQLAADLVREQPQGTTVEVSSQDFSALSRFVMILQILGSDDPAALRELVDESIAPRIASVSGVSRAMPLGGAPREITVEIDPERCAALGVSAALVTQTLAQNVRRLAYVGGSEDEGGRTAVVVDGRPRGVVSLGELRVRPDSPVLIRHVATINDGFGRDESEFRVNGKPAVGLIVFKDESANLVRLGRDVRTRLDELEAEFTEHGIEFQLSFDAADAVEDQIARLRGLGLSGFAIALVVLLGFLREPRAVAVVGAAVPVSLLAALAMLFVGGYSINLLSLFGLAVGIGMLVDNSIVVYEAVQRQLERGASPDEAAAQGIGRTVRAILAASATNAVVFLPLVFIDIENSAVSSLLTILAVSILLPLAGSILVATGLVPLLARRLAAPAALRRLEKARRESVLLGGLRPPERAREVFSGLLVVALRRPGAWVSASAFAVIVTVIFALPFVSELAPEEQAEQVPQLRIDIELTGGQSLDAAREVVESLREAAASIEGVRMVETLAQEDGGWVNLVFEDPEDLPEDFSATRTRLRMERVANSIAGVAVKVPETQTGGGGGASGGDPTQQALGTAPGEIVLSGPDTSKLRALAGELSARLQTIDEVGSVYTSGGRGNDELRVQPSALMLQAFGMTADEVLPLLGIVRREGIAMQTGFTLLDGREVPLVVRRKEPEAEGRRYLETLPVPTAGINVPMGEIAEMRRVPAVPPIEHRDGRREISVLYRLNPNKAPAPGPARQALESRIRESLRETSRPSGYTITVREPDEGTKWFRDVVVPVLLLLFAVLAITFESLTLPILVLLALPLTLIGGVWTLLLSGMQANLMALVGALCLMGLTVNPAILLVDRMKTRVLSGHTSAGAAALAAVRERARPVLMTTTTTLAGLWPLALSTGRENELWPPFATVIMGGLVTSTLLTLLVIPVGFVVLHRLDQLFGRLGPWVVMGWIGATALVVGPLVYTETISSLQWQIITTVLVAGLWLGVAALAFRRREIPDPLAAGSPPAVEVRSLHKVYGELGPVRHAWRLPELFARRVVERGGRPFHPSQARRRLLPLGLLSGGLVYLAWFIGAAFWKLLALFLAAWAIGTFAAELRRSRGMADELGRVLPGGPEGLVRAAAPWLALGLAAFEFLSRTASSGGRIRVAIIVGILALLVLFVQLGRRTARRMADGSVRSAEAGGLRGLWRAASETLFSFDLAKNEVHALSNMDFRAERGMIGVLGPNGAGKTTLLRTLAGILQPSGGVVNLGGVRLKTLQKHLGRYIGYLPQDFGLPAGMTAREYLEYYALLYEIEPAAERSERVTRLLEEVGLGERADERIGSFSGGMRQRVAVARTLLRLPPVIIVDEPTVGLDPRERIRFRNLLARLAQGRIVLFSTHVVEDVAVACERVIVVTGGRIAFDGTPHELAQSAQGRVWKLRLSASGWTPPPGARVVDIVPEAGGLSRLRILADERPHPDAEASEAQLEDAYFLLTGVSAEGPSDEEAA